MRIHGVVFNCKRLARIAAISTAAMFADDARSQASFALRNIDTAYGVDAPVFSSEGGLLDGPTYRAELYGGASPDSLSPLIIVGTGAREIVPLRTPGYFYSNTGFLSVLDVPPLGWAWLQLRVWENNLGSTYEEAAGRGIGGYGESPLFYAMGGDPVSPTGTLPGALIGLQSFSLRPVPEPSTWALLALGGVGIWWLRRRAGRG